VAVEKLFFEKSAKITSRQDALQTIFSTRPYISGHPFLRGFRWRPSFSTATGFFANYGLARTPGPRLPQLTTNSDSRQCSSIVRDCELLLKAQGGIRNQNYAFSEPVYEACRPHRKISTDTDQMCPVRLHYGWSEGAHREAGPAA